jgi:hypothetical protein
MEWKEDMVKQVFMPHDADEALWIIVPKVDIEDFVSSHFEVRYTKVRRRLPHISAAMHHRIGRNFGGINDIW